VFRHIFVALTLFLFAWIFILLYFDFDSWIKVIVIVANKILALFGYNSKMDSPFLRGKYGDIFVGETCLGLKIMFGFVVSIYFTGIKLFPKIRFIIIGLIIFNFLNILRIVLVFIHLQIYKNYQMAVDAHDFLKYPLHLVILILWIVWLNKYSDIWPYTKKREKSQVKL
jgi:exosortase/archaeosortase family protein